MGKKVPSFVAKLSSQNTDMPFLLTGTDASF
jgi:hypothetical protein